MTQTVRQLDGFGIHNTETVSREMCDGCLRPESEYSLQDVCGNEHMRN